MLDSFSQLAFPVQALIATLFTWALTSLGACVVFFMRQPNRNVMDAMLGLAGGVMVAAAFWSLLSPSIDMSASLGMNPVQRTAGPAPPGGQRQKGGLQTLCHAGLFHHPP